MKYDFFELNLSFKEHGWSLNVLNRFIFVEYLETKSLHLNRNFSKVLLNGSWIFICNLCSTEYIGVRSPV